MKINGRAFAQKIIAGFGTNDVYVIAEKSGVKIVYGDWHPVTIGEFERRTLTISVNRKALDGGKNGANLEKTIIAHELGHFFAIDLKLGKPDEEVFAREFAESMMENSGKFFAKAQSPQSEKDTNIKH